MNDEPVYISKIKIEKVKGRDVLTCPPKKNGSGSALMRKSRTTYGEAPINA